MKKKFGKKKFRLNVTYKGKLYKFRVTVPFEKDGTWYLLKRVSKHKGWNIEDLEISECCRVG